METPSLVHLNAADYQNVYEPAEDTFLLIDALEKDMELIQSLRPQLCVEVGSGAGCVITAVGRLLGNFSYYMATDINPFAAAVTSQTAFHNGVHVETVVCDLLFPLEERLHHKVDLLIFNPPYVVTPSEEIGSHGIEASWAGGLKGREVIDRFLPYIAHFLSANGLFYLVTIKENEPDEISASMRKWNIHSTKVLSRRCGSEFLSVLRMSRQRF